MNATSQKARLAQMYAVSSKPYHIIERQQLVRGYARIIYKCRRCERRIARLSLHNSKIIGFKSAESFPLCPYCEEVST